MLEWLLSPIDPSRGHDVGFFLSWHARCMVIAWGVICPAAILAARYFKIMPGQNWPQELDNRTWWVCHWKGQVFTYALSLVGLGLILAGGRDQAGAGLHRFLGYTVLALGTIQIAMGTFRGTKGGPTALAKDGSMSGDHYDMTRWRVAFEHTHRFLGYLALFLAAVAILSGLWSSNAPRWMWIAINLYWLFLALVAVSLQRSGKAYDTYQAIWGPDPTLPGNRRAKMGWGTVRPGDQLEYSPQEGTK
ncbi:MAG: cytochrome b561 domain-containing protein [Pseudomonadota bacterium]